MNDLDSQKQLLKRSVEAKDIFIPHISADPVVFGFDKNELKVLLAKMHYKNNGFYPVAMWEKMKIWTRL